MRKGLIVVIAVALFASIVSSVRVVQKKISRAQVEADAENMVEIEFFSSIASKLQSASKMLVSKTVTCAVCKPTIPAILSTVKSAGCNAATAAVVASPCPFCAVPFRLVCPDILEAATKSIKTSPEEACSMMKLC